MSRPDRDGSVEILWDNLLQGHQKNFGIEENIGLQINFWFQKKSFLDSRGFPYDPYSIMHYSVGDFSRNGEDTIRFKDPSVDLINVG